MTRAKYWNTVVIITIRLEQVLDKNSRNRNINFRLKFNKLAKKNHAGVIVKEGLQSSNLL